MHWVNIWAYTWYTTEESFHHVAFSGALTEGMGLIPTPSSEVEVAWDAAPTPARLCQRPLERLPPGMYSLTCQVTASSGRFGWDGLKFDKWSPDEMALWRPVDVQWPAIVWHFVLTPPRTPSSDQHSPFQVWSPREVILLVTSTLHKNDGKQNDVKTMGKLGEFFWIFENL